MLKERIQEVFEFTKSESPYRKANKGWINQDMYLQLGASLEPFDNKNEAAKVTLLWPPISKLISNIFFTFIVGSIVVFSSVTFSKVKIDLGLLNMSAKDNAVQVEDEKVVISLEEVVKEDLNELPNQNKAITDSSIKINTDIQKTAISKNEIKTKKLSNLDENKVMKNQKSKSNFF